MSSVPKPSVGYSEDVERIIAEIVLDIPDARGGMMFGLPAYYVGRKLFACVYGAGVGIKLPAATISGLRGPHLVPFQPYGRAPMREWIEIRRPQATDYRRDSQLLHLAAGFARSAAATPEEP